MTRQLEQSGCKMNIDVDSSELNRSSIATVRTGNLSSEKCDSSDDPRSAPLFSMFRSSRQIRGSKRTTSLPSRSVNSIFGKGSVSDDDDSDNDDPADKNNNHVDKSRQNRRNSVNGSFASWRAWSSSRKDFSDHTNNDDNDDRRRRQRESCHNRYENDIAMLDDLAADTEHSFHSATSSILEMGKKTLTKAITNYFPGEDYYDDNDDENSFTDDLDTTHYRGEAVIDEDCEFIFGGSGSVDKDIGENGSNHEERTDGSYVGGNSRSSSRNAMNHQSSSDNNNTSMGNAIYNAGTSFRGALSSMPSIRGMNSSSSNHSTTGTNNQEKYEKQISQLHKRYSHDELMEIFQLIHTQKAAAAIIHHQFDNIKKEMKRHGFVTDLALLQVSRGIVSNNMIREIEKGEARKHLSGF